MATFVIFSHLRNAMRFHLLTSSLKFSLVFKNIIHIGITLFLLFLFPVTLLLMYVGFLFFYILWLFVYIKDSNFCITILGLILDMPPVSSLL